MTLINRAVSWSHFFLLKSSYGWSAGLHTLSPLFIHTFPPNPTQLFLKATGDLWPCSFLLVLLLEVSSPTVSVMLHFTVPVTWELKFTKVWKQFPARLGQVTGFNRVNCRRGFQSSVPFLKLTRSKTTAGASEIREGSYRSSPPVQLWEPEDWWGAVVLGNWNGCLHQKPRESQSMEPKEIRKHTFVYSLFHSFTHSFHSAAADGAKDKAVNQRKILECFDTTLSTPLQSQLFLFRGFI